jgi:hypothetical protein
MVLMPLFQSKPRSFDIVELTRFPATFCVENRSLTAHCESVPAKLLVQSNQPGRLQVVIHLITANVMIGQQPASKLEAIVDPALSFQLRLKFQLEIRQFATAPDKILVYCAWMFPRDSPDNGPIFYSPIAGIRGFPTIQGLSIENRFKTIFLCRGRAQHTATDGKYNRQDLTEPGCSHKQKLDETRQIVMLKGFDEKG